MNNKEGNDESFECLEIDFSLDTFGVDFSNITEKIPESDKVLATPAVRLVLSRIVYGVRHKSPLCIVAGEHGAGKSTSARLYVQNNPRALYWEAPPEYSAREVVADLCQKLSINAGEAWRIRTSVLVSHLKDHPYTILIDEAQRLDYKALDMIKYVADNSGTTFILLGSPWLDRIVDRHTDISSRAHVRVRVQPIDLNSLHDIYAKEGYNAQTIKAVHDATRGIMRSITALLQHLDEGLTKHNKNPNGKKPMTRGDLTAEHVRRVAYEVL